MAMSKREKAQRAFIEMKTAGKGRGDILARFQTKSVGLTEKGAQTYYQKFNKVGVEALQAADTAAEAKKAAKAAKKSVKKTTAVETPAAPADGEPAANTTKGVATQ